MADSIKKVLVLSFRTDSDKEYNLTIDNPKDDLTLTEATNAADAILSSDVFVSNDEEGLTSVNSIYYRETRVTLLTDPGGRE